jgi:DNA-binding CsgD family transcriptional regulator
LGRDTILIFRPLDMEQMYPLPAPAPGQLGQRQLEVLQCIAKGMTTRQVAAQLGISRRTIYMHLAAIRRSLSAISTADAVRRAAELGLCLPPAKSGS